MIIHGRRGWKIEFNKLKSIEKITWGKKLRIINLNLNPLHGFFSRQPPLISLICDTPPSFPPALTPNNPSHMSAVRDPGLRAKKISWQIKTQFRIAPVPSSATAVRSSSRSTYAVMKRRQKRLLRMIWKQIMWRLVALKFPFKLYRQKFFFHFSKNNYLSEFSIFKLRLKNFFFGKRKCHFAFFLKSFVALPISQKIFSISWNS